MVLGLHGASILEEGRTDLAERREKGGAGGTLRARLGT